MEKKLTYAAGFDCAAAQKFRKKGEW